MKLNLFTCRNIFFEFRGICVLLCLCLLSLFSISQSLPDAMHYSPDGRRLITGNLPYSGFYDQSTTRDIFLDFSQPDYWDDLESNYSNQIDMPATLTIDGVVYDSVGVRFKGATSYSSSNDFKKSFNITLNAYIPGQDVGGYNIVNLNNGYNDPSFMGEVLYEFMLSKHMPAAKGNFAHLVINGNDWGIYGNVQQLNKDFVEEWFLSKGGALWRAKRPEGSPAPHGVRGDSLRTLYYLGSDTTQYVNNYDLKFSGFPDPYTRLRDFCKILDTVSQSNMETILDNYLDIDRTLWFFAGENIFGDDDSYIEKGRSDYYLYMDSETGRIVPIEMDGNDTFDPDKHNYSIFSHVNKPNYALLYKLLNHPQIRQRYLAHMRTMVNEVLDTAKIFPVIDAFYSQIDPIVQNDVVQNYTYADFLNHKSVLKNYILNRKAYITSNSEINKNLPLISNSVFYSDTTAWEAPGANENVLVTSNVTCQDGVDAVFFYYASGLTGHFSKVLMYDDGTHQDSIAGDSVYTGLIPGMPGVTRMRFYIEAVSANSAATVSYDPPGAEHDIYTYLVKPEPATDSSVVINELMAKNVSTAADTAGNYSDWIEIYNTSGQPKDISGFYLSDNPMNLLKWSFPPGTIIQPDEYLIVWANDDEGFGGLNTNFKLSGDGDELWFLNSNMELINHLNFGVQQADEAHARIPNGTGNFMTWSPSFQLNNNPVPVAAFTADVSSGCVPFTVNFTNASQGATDFQWDFGDGTTSNLISPSHVYNSDGTYTVSLISGIFGINDTISSPGIVSAFASPSISFAADTIFSSAITFNLNVDSSYSSVLWSTMDTSYSILVDVEGFYCVSVLDQNSCTDSACVYVVLNTVSIPENVNDKIKLFPNPSEKYIVVSLPAVSKTQAGLNIEIFNSNGKIVYNRLYVENATISTEEWEAGIYYLKVGAFSKLFIVSN
ncbi:MAG: T9SS type A sorting domain-containing protein [Bacteroidetes bacterium]|nr:MAG: T9SS type A sorting domain-containing protein [Bacteroidota bacterium]